MAKREIKTDKIRTPSGVFSQATVIEAQGRLVFISGMTARRPDGTIAGIGDITAQTKQVCENIKSAVETAGGTLDDVCRVDVYVRNMEHFKEIHAVRQEYFKPPLPASRISASDSGMASPTRKFTRFDPARRCCARRWRGCKRPDSKCPKSRISFFNPDPMMTFAQCSRLERY